MRDDAHLYSVFDAQNCAARSWGALTGCVYRAKIFFFEAFSKNTKNISEQFYVSRKRRDTRNSTIRSYNHAQRLKMLSLFSPERKKVKMLLARFFYYKNDRFSLGFFFF